MSKLTSLLLFGFLVICTNGKVISCGGFVRSFVPNILSQVKIKVLTAEGNLKYETDCTPSNGYWMAPIYNEGSYIFRVEGPSGLIFRPAEIKIEINGENDLCTTSQDINFDLFGFKVTGKVKNANSPVSLALYSSDGSKHATTLTAKDGSYGFEAAPGNYKLAMESTEQCVERGSVPVAVVDSPIVVQPDISIAGQSLIIKVLSENNKPASGVEVTLESATEFHTQPSLTKPVQSKEKGRFYYSLKSDANGGAVFPCLPSGNYKVRSKSAAKNIVLNFEPAVKDVSVSTKVEEIVFRSQGYSLVGKVMVGSQPLSKVQVKIDGQLIGKSDDNGAFKISNLGAGSHKIDAVLEHYEFGKSDYVLDHLSPTIPIIHAKRIEVCGHVSFDDPALVKSDFKVEFFEGNNLIAQSDVSKQFCAFLKPGSYKVKPNWSSPPVNPELIEIELKNKPILDLLFTEFKGDISGNVKLLGEFPGSTVVLSLAGRIVSNTPITNGNFVFKGVTPGNYKLSVNGASTACWEHDSVSVKVSTANVDKVLLKQTGYKVEVVSKKPAILKWTAEAGSQIGSVQIADGSAQFCVPAAGIYNIQLESCHNFKQGQTFQHAVPSETLFLEATHSLISASIISESNAGSNDFKVTAQAEGFEAPFSRISSKNGNQTYSLSVPHTQLSTTLKLYAGSERFLFTPQSHLLDFKGDCSYNVATFKAVEGKYVAGIVKPPISNVLITAIHKESGETLQGKTDSQGKFRIGLVWDPNEYNAEAELEGFKFTKSGDKNTFTAIQLSKLVVNYYDEATKRPLPEVLISLSGGDSYRSSEVVDQTGRISFVGLPEGEYFVRSILREYQFPETSTSVHIKGGETVELNLHGKRYAYSAFGSVKTAGGLPVKDVVVEAVSKSCGNVQVDDITNEDGGFRVRGLKPSCNYILSVFGRDRQRIPSIPPFLSVDAKEEDATELEFTLITSIPSNEIIGSVVFDNVKRPKHLRIDVYEGTTLKTHQILSGQNNLFIIPDVLTVSKEYRVAIHESDLRNMNAVSEGHSFVATETHKSVVLNIQTKPRKMDIETSRSNILGIIFVLLTSFITLNYTWTKTFFSNLIDQAVTIISRQREEDSAERRRAAKRN